MQRAEAHQRARKRGEDLLLLGLWNVEVIEAASELRSHFIELLRRDLGLARGDLKPQRGWTRLGRASQSKPQGGSPAYQS